MHELYSQGWVNRICWLLGSFLQSLLNEVFSSEAWFLIPVFQLRAVLFGCLLWLHPCLSQQRFFSLLPGTQTASPVFSWLFYQPFFPILTIYYCDSAVMWKSVWICRMLNFRPLSGIIHLVRFLVWRHCGGKIVSLLLRNRTWPWNHN